jgi:hypothetical protein
METRAELLWHADEAYLLVATGYLGYRATPATLLPELLMLMPFGVQASDSRRTLLVFRITTDRVERHVVNGPQTGPFGVIDDRITDGTWLWQGDHFERPTTTEISVHPTDPEYSGVDGWSKRRLNSGTSPPEGWTVSFSLSGQAVRLTSRGVSRVWQAIDLQRGNAPVERLWSLDERHRSVNRAEYEAIFKR